MRAVAAGAGRVDEVVAARLDGEHVRAHRLGAAGDLVRRLALRAQRDEEAADLRGRRVAGHDLAHDLARLVAAEVAAVEHLLERLLDHRPRKFRAISRPSGVSTDSGWNWTPSIGSSSMPDGHDLAVARRSPRPRAAREPCGREGVVAADFELVREPGEQAAAVVPDGAGLPVHELLRGLDLAAEGFDDRLMAEADAQRGHGRCQAADNVRRGPGVGRPAGARGDDEVGRAEPCRPVGVDRVVAADDHLRAELAEQVREVVRERVVVVDQQDQRCSASARSIAASTAASLRRHSSCSAAGSESATMPAPACRCATPSCNTIVRMAMHVSSVASSGNA